MLATPTSVLSAAPLLRPLQPETSLAPHALSPRTRLLAALSRVASVRVPTSVKANGHRFYVIDLQTLPPSIALTRLQVTSLPSMQWRFADFINLRDELYYHIRRGHREHKRPCAYCHHVRETLTHTTALPSLYQLVFANADAVCQQLEHFLNTVLQLALAVKNHRDLAWCPGQSMVPLLVKQFLLGKSGEDEDDASVSPRSASSCGVDPFRPAASAGLAFS